MSNTYKRDRNRKIRKEVGDISKYTMIKALLAKRLRMKYRRRISEENIRSLASFLGFFLLIFSYPYDFVKKRIIMLKLKRKLGKH